MNKFAAHALRPWGYSGWVWRVRSPLAGVRQGLLIPSAVNAFYSSGLVVPIHRFSDLRPSTMSTDPAVPQPRVIVLCFDGTSNQYDATVSSRANSSSSVGSWLTRKSTRTRTSSSFTLC